MAFTNPDLLALKAELTNDPLTLGLTILAADDEANANKLNAISVASSIDRESIPTSEIMLNIDRDEFGALSPSDRQWLLGIGQGGSINPKQGGEVYEGILQLFAAGTESRGNLIDILKEPASRATQLFKLGTISTSEQITPSTISQARQAT